MKCVMIILITIISLLAQEYEDSVFNSLVAIYNKRPLNDRLLYDQIHRISSSDVSDKEDILVRFARLKNNQYSGYAIGALIELEDSVSISLYDELKYSVSWFSWSKGISSALRKNRWKMEEFHMMFFEVLRNSKNIDVKKNIYRYLNHNARYKDMEFIRGMLNVESNKYIRLSLYSSFAQYADSSCTQQIITWFNEYKEPEQISFLISNGIYYNNRYDLIDELIDFRFRLEEIDDIERKHDAEELIKTINDVLPKLEKAKKKKLPIGKPLDWGI